METELAKSKAKEQVLSSIMEAAARSFVPNPVSLETRKSEGKVEASCQLTVAVGCSTLNPEAAEWHQPQC